MDDDENGLHEPVQTVSRRANPTCMSGRLLAHAKGNGQSAQLKLVTGIEAMASAKPFSQLSGDAMYDACLCFHERDRELAEIVFSWISPRLSVLMSDLSSTPSIDTDARMVIVLWTANSIASEQALSIARLATYYGRMFGICLGLTSEQAATIPNNKHGSQDNTYLLDKLEPYYRNVYDGIILYDYELKSREEARKLKRGRRLFISHASQDHQFASKLVEHVEQRGLKCWIAPRDVPVGSDYRSSIVDAIESSAATVLVYSSRANQSFDIANELLISRKRNKPLFPLRLDRSTPSGAVEYELVTVQWIDATDKRIAAFEELVQRVKPLTMVK